MDCSPWCTQAQLWPLTPAEAHSNELLILSCERRSSSKLSDATSLKTAISVSPHAPFHVRVDSLRHFSNSRRPHPGGHSTAGS
eukprot:2308772-Prymnesium_polylepis.1